MSITRLALSNYRNHADATIAPGSGFVVLTGDNGAGKTNILEAVSLLVPGRGLRGAALSAVARQEGPGGFAVSARLGDVELGTGALASAPDRRVVRINGAAAPATALSEWLSVVWLTPAMDRLFTDSAGERRRFLDRLVLALEPAHAGHSARYDAAIRQRNRLLAADDTPDPHWLSALEGQMAAHGTAIAEARARLVAQLGDEMAKAQEGSFPRARLSLEGWDYRDDLAAQLSAGRSRDRAAGRTLAGPHRSDLAVAHATKDQPAALCSTGEQKALLLRIILAHAALVARQVGTPPLLLFDEVAAHLDPLRRAALFERLEETGSQVWMTGTEAALFTGLPAGASHFRIAAGTITTG